MNFAVPLTQEQVAKKLTTLDRVAGRQSSEFVPPPDRPWNFGGTTPKGTETLAHADLSAAGVSPFGDDEVGPLGNYTDLPSPPPLKQRTLCNL